MGKSVISTDITGPRGFMKKYGRMLVENSRDGIEKGLKMLYDNDVKNLCVDYDKYNQEVVEQFEALL